MNKFKAKDDMYHPKDFAVDFSPSRCLCDFDEPTICYFLINEIIVYVSSLSSVSETKLRKRYNVNETPNSGYFQSFLGAVQSAT